ncbi:MAG: tetratricopeptide repeat protein [Verrucomicrobiae bacterium]|nr:tetratricopeptide repeat protein [Verrucomicrobiae bacterium]
MSKISMVPLPFAMLFLDVWPLKRSAPWPGLLAEKWPLYLLAAVAGLQAVLQARNQGILIGVEHYGIASRLGGMLVSYVWYLKGIFLPLDFALLYPHPGNGLAWGTIAFSLLVLLFLTGCFICLRKSHPWLLSGWGWFLVMLLPFTGLFQWNEQWTADRYAYFPMIGLSFSAVWSATAWPHCATLWRRDAPAVILTVLASQCWHQQSHWKDSQTLFAHTLTLYPHNPVAQNQMGLGLMEKGDIAGAIFHFCEAITFRPSREPWNNLGLAFERNGQLQEAAIAFQKAVAIAPDNALAHLNLGRVLTASGNLSAAERHLRQAVHLAPHSGNAHYTLALALLKQRRWQEARAALSRAISISPAIGLSIDAFDAIEKEFHSQKNCLSPTP